MKAGAAQQACCCGGVERGGHSSQKQSAALLPEGFLRQFFVAQSSLWMTSSLEAKLLNDYILVAGCHKDDLL